MLEFARDAFARRGFHAVSMDEIAEAAGVTKPIAYKLFGSKEGVFAAGVHGAYEACIERMAEAAAVGGPPDQRLWRLTRAFFAWLAENRDHWHLVYGAQAVGGLVAEEGARDRAGVVALLAGVLREIVDDPSRAGEAEVLAEVAVAVHMAIADYWTRHPDEPVELQELRAMNACWTGFSGLLEGRLWLPQQPSG